MKKILNTDQVRAADVYTIEHEPVSSVDLMERAGQECTLAISGLVGYDDRIGVVAGRGNNGGDGLVIARRLLEMGYDVKVFLVGGGEEGSGDFMVNLARLQLTGAGYMMLEEGFSPEVLRGFDWLVDSLFGSGLSRPVTGLPALVIDAMNLSGAGVISVDLPSGLFADSYTDSREGSIVRAHTTLTLEVPRLAMVMPCCHPYIGEWQVVSIGLDSGYIASLETPWSLFGFEEACRMFRPRGRVTHKGDHGHGFLLAGGAGTGGAAMLSAMGALRSGVGLLTAAVPGALAIPFHTALPEAMLHAEPESAGDLSDTGALRYTALAAGPGWGTSPAKAHLLHDILTRVHLPMVLDADALNILSVNPDWLEKLLPGTILTPHPKEFDRLAGRSDNDFHRLEKARDFAIRHQCVVVLKTAFPAVITPDGRCFFAVHGTAGLAKGGTGDLLTGVILGCLCRGYPPVDAAMMGVWLHARAASIVALSNGLDAVTATDIASMLGKAFKELENGRLAPDPDR